MTRPPVYAGLCASLTLTLTLTKTHTGRACPFSTLAGVDILGAELSTIPDIFTILLFYYFVLYIRLKPLHTQVTAMLLDNRRDTSVL